jgi:hypothetical protein
VSTLDSYRTLAAAPDVGATTAFRMGAGYWGIWATRTPNLIALGLEAWTPGAKADEAADTFWDELITVTRDSTEAALDELQRGIHDLDEFTGAEQGSSTRTQRASRERD